MVKFNQRGGKPKGQKHFQGKGKKDSSKQRKNPHGKRKFNKKKDVSVDQLDRELELYWGNEVGSKHLDKDMDEYWKNKKEEPKQ